MKKLSVLLFITIFLQSSPIESGMRNYLHFSWFQNILPKNKLLLLGTGLGLTALTVMWYKYYYGAKKEKLSRSKLPVKKPRQPSVVKQPKVTKLFEDPFPQWSLTSVENMLAYLKVVTEIDIKTKENEYDYVKKFPTFHFPEENGREYWVKNAQNKADWEALINLDNLRALLGSAREELESQIPEEEFKRQIGDWQSRLQGSQEFLKEYPASEEAKNQVARNQKIVENLGQKNTQDFFIEELRHFQENDRLFFIGDLHGGVQGILPFFKDQEKNEIVLNNNLRIKEEYRHYHYIMLGDFTDSGPHSLETLMLLLVLYLKNPDNVHLVRGNHEAYYTELNRTYGFYTELSNKFPLLTGDLLKELKENIQYLYQYIPVVLFAKFQNIIIPCCHGMIDTDEEADDVRQFLSQEEDTRKLVKNVYLSGGAFGSRYEWNNCLPFEEGGSAYEHTRELGNGIPQKLTDQFLQNISPEKHTVPFIMRAHQHNYSLYGFDDRSKNPYILNLQEKYYRNENLMPIFFANYYIAFLWSRQNPLVFTLSFNPFASAGMQYKHFPGISHSTICEISGGGRTVTAWRLPNETITDNDEFKNKYSEQLAKFFYNTMYYYTVEKKNDNDKEEFFATLYDHYKKFREKEQQFESQETLQSFFKKILEVHVPEKVAIWEFNEPSKKLQLQEFVLPQSLGEK